MIKFLTGSLLLVILTACQPRSAVRQITAPVITDNLAANFATPPKEARPWVYWYWINNHISRVGITRDLESMAATGIGAALIGNIYLDNVTADGTVAMMSDEWMELTRHAIREGGRLGVDIGLFNSPGWSQSGGPWNDAGNTMRYLASTDTTVTGPATFKGLLPAAGEDFQDVALLAYPAPLEPPLPANAFLSSAEDLDLTGKKEAIIEISADSAYAIRSLRLTPTNSTFVMDVSLQAESGGRWVEVRAFHFDRSSDMKQISYTPYNPVEVAFPATTASRFRLKLSGIQPTRGATEYGLSAIQLSPTARLEFAAEKQLALMHPTPLPLDDAYRWPEQPEPEAGQLVDPEQVVNLSDLLLSDGSLEWRVPAGNWTIVRTGMLPTAIENSPAALSGQGPEVDKMNRGALQQHWDGFVGKVMEGMPANERAALKYVVADSYETGSQNWTDDFEAPFREEYGYDPLPWLPVLNGTIVGSADRSNRFLWDLRRLVADRVAYEYVGGLREICEENGLQLWLENYGHWGFPSEFLTYGGQSSLVGGEFWAEGDLGSIECKAASSAAHIYGKEQVSAESYTAAGKPFQRHPGMLKRRGDWSYTEGINHRVFHVYIQQPYEDKRPGVNAWFGTEFNRFNTWFPEAGSWIDYETRTGYLLRRGHYVADLAYFIGEDAPKMTGVANPALPEGYSYDYINAEVLLERSRVENGKIVLTDGMTYSVLVLPASERMRPEMVARIGELVGQGATVVGPPPTHSPSLSNYGKADERVKVLTDKFWSKVQQTDDLAEVLQQSGNEPDLIMEPGTQVLWTHRMQADRDIYFLTNQTEDAVTFTPSFRVTEGMPEWWDPLSGAVRQLPDFERSGGRTELSVTLPPAGSGFVVFRRDGRPDEAINGGENFPLSTNLVTIDDPWEIHFKQDFLGIDTTITSTKLTDWTEDPSPTIRYFSGTATYRTQLQSGRIDEDKRVFLDLGKVNVIANVRINGRDVGGLWTAPWQLDVTDFVRPGQNELEISVTNLWVNELIQDSARPDDQKKLWMLTGNEYRSDSELAPSGLVGPVRLVGY